ncbi:MAG: DUF4157 domain-containing protein [Myxococcales bacterium]|nr:DUF4157 domain-containing protein [Myxococcales bacterium]
MDSALSAALGLGGDSVSPVQRKAADPGSGGSLGVTAAAGLTDSPQALPHQQAIQRSFGDHDLSGVRAHVGGAAAAATEAIGAEAYATGSSVAFREAPSLHTAAHEAAHVVQQRAGVHLLGGVGQAGDAYEQNADAVADRVVAGKSAADLLPKAGGGGVGGVQLRRLPTNTGAMLTDPAQPTQQGANYAANAAGTRRLIELAEAELTVPQRAQVQTATLAGQTQAAFDALPEQTRLTRRVEAIRSVRPDLTLGDPMLINTGPRPSTTDTANLQTLIDNANAIFDAIAGGTHDVGLGQVFGTAHVATAKTKYALAKTWMNNLHTNHHIVTDRSGYNAEVGLGGLTGFQRQIALSPRSLDSPSDNEAVVTMIHESMHAGNSDVKDKGYIGTQVFTQLPEDVKLTNAAHFEVVPRRIRNAANAYAGQTFTPAGTAPASGGPVTPPLTAMQTAVRDASERIRIAWTMGLNLHVQYDTLYKDQSLWAAPRGASSFRVGLPYWSKVEKLTIHEKTVFEPASADPARRPISQIDMALSEGVTRKFMLCMREMRNVPNDDAAATTYLATRASPAEITAAQATPTGHRDLWIKVALGAVGSITGPVDRDLRVVHELYTLSTAYGTLLQQRDLNGFVD